MIKMIVIPIVTIGAIIVALTVYLQPNDLGGCSSTDTAACAPVGAIVAISGGDTNARTDQAIRLYKSGWANVLIFSGAASDAAGPSNAATMRARAVAAGVPHTSIHIDEQARNTRENAENTQVILEDRGIDSMILVTSGYHQRRASIEFKKHAGDVEVFNYPVKNDKDWSIWWWLTPRGWWLAFGEFSKIIAFYLWGARA